MSDRPNWETDGRDWPNRTASRFVVASGFRWHVQIAGDGPVLLLLHGTGAATHSWRDMLAPLAERFTVIAADLPGQGFTARGPTSLPDMARAIAALLDEVGLQPPMIVGHSAGAAIGLRMVLDKHVAPAAFVGLSAALLPFPGLASKLFPTLAKLLFVNPFVPHIFARIARGRGEVGRFLARSTGSTIDVAGVDGYARLFCKPGHIAGTVAMMANWDLDPLAHDLPTLATPLLLIHGEADAAIPIATAHEAAALVPGARLEALAALGHLAHEEAPERVVALIVDFARETGVLA